MQTPSSESDPKALVVTFEIDGRDVQAIEGTTVLEAAKQNRIPIPHLCYHPALKPSGACRLCSVEIDSPSGKPIVMLSCVLKTKAGLTVRTSTEAVVRAREAAVEKMLKKAPFSTRIRNTAAAYGIQAPPPPDGCIQCRMCVRVCSEVIQARALRMVKENGANRVVPEPGRCIGCGTCANLCPTSLIRVEDRDNIRTVSIKDTVIGQLPLERCEGCGAQYITATFFTHVSHSTENHPHVKEEHRFCPTCIKLMSDKALSEKEHLSQKPLAGKSPIII